jgi:hypothetical protein
VRYDLAEVVFEQEGWPPLRLIAVKKNNGEQTHILATGRVTWEATGDSVEDYVDPPAVEMAWWMFGRWRQENWFKYMEEEYALDVLVDYQVDADDPERLVPNPQRRELDRKVATARQQLQREQANYARLALQQEQSAKDSDGKQDVKDCASCGQCLSCQQRLQAAVVKHCSEQLEHLRAQRRAAPEKIRLGDVHNRDPVKLSYERKLFTDTVKLCAYEIETRLHGMLDAEFLRGNFEGRSLIRDILQAPGDIRVNNGTLEVHLEQLSAPRYTQAQQCLCEQLNALHPTLPETSLALRFFVQPRPVGE